MYDGVFFFFFFPVVTTTSSYQCVCCTTTTTTTTTTTVVRIILLLLLMLLVVVVVTGLSVCFFKNNKSIYDRKNLIGLKYFGVYPLVVYILNESSSSSKYPIKNPYVWD